MADYFRNLFFLACLMFSWEISCHSFSHWLNFIWVGLWVLNIDMQLQLNAAETTAYNEIEEAMRVRITREIKQKTQALTINLIKNFT
jgi:hypothetical protein